MNKDSGGTTVTRSKTAQQLQQNLQSSSAVIESLPDHCDVADQLSKGVSEQECTSSCSNPQATVRTNRTSSRPQKKARKEHSLPPPNVPAKKGELWLATWLKFVVLLISHFHLLFDRKIMNYFHTMHLSGNLCTGCQEIIDFPPVHTILNKSWKKTTLLSKIKFNYE